MTSIESPADKPAGSDQPKGQDEGKTSRGMDPELIAVGRILRELAEFDDKAQRRMLGYLNDRIGRPEY